MIRILRFATLLLLLAPAVLKAQGARSCIDQARTQMEMTDCAAAELARADSVLNDVYRQVIAGMDSATVPLLRQAQRAWIGLRDADCEVENAEFEGGSIHPMLYAMCVAHQTRQRTAHLRQMLPSDNADDAGGRSGIVRATEALFAAMQEKDTAALRTLLHPRALIVAVSERGVGVRTADEWIPTVVRSPEVLRERMWDARIEMDGDLATLWAPYDFHMGERFSHCGMDAFQFVREGGVWRMISVAFTRRTTGCEVAP
jgi:uncharacterized protein YecT (DUF1311 family)